MCYEYSKPEGITNMIASIAERAVSIDKDGTIALLILNEIGHADLSMIILPKNIEEVPILVLR